MDLLIFLYIPAITAAVALLIPRKLKYFQETIAVIGSLIFLKFGLESFTVDDQFLTISWFQISSLNFALDFRLYHFSRFLLVFLGLFTSLTTLYSAGYFLCAIDCLGIGHPPSFFPHCHGRRKISCHGCRKSVRHSGFY